MVGIAAIRNNFTTNPRLISDGYGNRNTEVDFLIPDGSKVSVIEVKSSRSTQHISIDEPKIDNKYSHLLDFYSPIVRHVSVYQPTS